MAGGREMGIIMAKYDYLVVGTGLFGSTFAQQMAEAGKRVLVLERREYLAGAAHCDMIEGIRVFRYGPHIFHTGDRAVWEYVNRFARFNSYVHTVVTASRKGVFEVPFNMSTFTRMWEDVLTPEDARLIIDRQIGWEDIDEPENLEEECLKRFGRDLYEELLRGYLEKRWGRPCQDLPANKLRFQPLRFTFDNRYFQEPYQGLPAEGYDVMVKRMLANCEVMLGTDYLPFRRVNPNIADKVIFTGAIDEFFRYKQGTLEYRTVSYKNEVRDMPNFQGIAVVNYQDPVIPYIRTIEHKHFWFGTQPKTVITRETPAEWNTGMEPCYPVNDEKNQKIYNAYRVLAVAQPDVTFCGRLGSFHYYSMGEAVRAALDMAAAQLR